MNYRMILRTLGLLLIFEAGFFTVPIITGLFYLEWRAILGFFIAAICSLGVGLAIHYFIKPKTTQLYSKDGYVIVALSWIVLSLFGALPFIFSGVTTSYIDALFETVSGFTTTGASIFGDVEALPHAILMWRSFTHWVGGMGVLVFIMAFLPLSGAQNMHIMKAESPGPSVSKLVPKVKTTALILYVLYFSLTFIEFILLLCGKASLFEALNLSFATAGTGGFGFRNDSVASFSPYIQIVVTVFMFLFSINFGSYYLLLKAKIKDAFNSEVRVFLLVVFSAILIIALNINNNFDTVGETIRHAAFTVASIISTAGFSTVDFNLWPELSKLILVFLMFVGACAGSTGGGMKVSRFIILGKGMSREVKNIVHPNQVKKITMDGRKVEHEVVRAVNSYVACFFVLFALSLFLLSFENLDFTTTFTATATTINNVGPGLAGVGPTQNFGFFSSFSKIVLIFNMLAGRLELFPMLVLFSPATYRKF